MTASYVNVYPGGPDEGWKLVLLKADGTKDYAENSYDYFIRTGDTFERIRCRTWKERKERVERESRPTYEGDLSSVRRWLADNPDVEIARPRRVYTDLECDPTPGFENKHLSRVLVACAVGEDGKEFVGVLDNWSDDAERRLLSAYFRFLMNYHVVCAWHGGSSFGNDGYDYPVLRARCEHLWPGASRRMNKLLWLDHLKAYRKLHLMFAESGEERSSYSLDNVSQFVLGEGKHEYDAKRCKIDWEAGGKARDQLVAYGLRDTQLLPRIEAKTGVLDLAYQIARLCGVLHDTSGLHATTFFDGFLLRLAGKRGLRLPTKPYEPGEVKKKNFVGAHVFEPNARGIEKNVYSYDVNSLYPSVYIMLNASPETKNKPGAVSPNTGVTFAQDTLGIFPEALIELGKMKKHWKTEYLKHPPGSKEYLDAKRIHDAVKSLVNSGYGYGGSKFARLYDKDIAESITLTGQFIIKAIAKAAEARGWRIVMGDTDSSYVHGATEQEIRAFIDWCNTDLLPGIAKAHHCQRPAPVLAFDKGYERLIVVGKKKYLGLYSDSKEYGTVGLEWRRGDASPLARKLQEAVCKLLMEERKEDPEDFVLPIVEFRNRVLHDELELKEVVLSESLGKPLDEYEGTSPAVSVARQMRERGEDVGQGTKIRYVVVDGDCSPVKAIAASQFTGEFDRYYTWQNLVYPPTRRLLEAAFPDRMELWESYAKVRPVVSPQGRRYEAREAKGQLRIPGLDS